MKPYFAPETSFIPPDYDQERTECPDSCEGCRFENLDGSCFENLKEQKERAENEQRWARSADALADMLQGKLKQDERNREGV